MINDIDNKNSNIGILFPAKTIPNANIENNTGIKYLENWFENFVKIIGNVKKANIENL
tara:strand:- start:1 stop:174 length:174 start_codon:yes stop_codon:yes gene_type:complete